MSILRFLMLALEQMKDGGGHGGRYVIPNMKRVSLDFILNVSVARVPCLGKSRGGYVSSIGETEPCVDH